MLAKQHLLKEIERGNNQTQQYISNSDVVAHNIEGAQTKLDEAKKNLESWFLF